ncbi:MAG: leucine-rich repeat domain-containing protein, partial [Clostridia bacterium]|nr:leucine-rich repeat domain-containing protein [Clostridia bacterium]
MKRFLSLFLSIVFVIGICVSVPVTITANAGNGDALKYSLNADSKSYTVTGFSGTSTKELVIPATYNGLPVTRIGDYAFCENTTIESVEIEENGVETIDLGAFFGCSSLKSAIMGNGVKIIGDEAFAECSALTEIKIPDSVTTIGGFAFSGVGYFSVANNWDNGAAYIGNHLVLVKKSFEGDFVMRNNTKTIAAGAFEDCDLITSIVISEGITKINNEEFFGCASLESVVIPGSVTSIGDSAFSYCYALEAINVAEENRFYKSVDGVLFNENMTQIIKVPSGKALESYIIPDSVTEIGSNVFSGCSFLKSITFGSGINNINISMFESCGSLAELKVSEGNKKYTSIDGVLFNKNKTELVKFPQGKNVASYTIPAGVTKIGSYALAHNEFIENVVIADSVKIIGGDAFYGCESLTGVTIGKSVESIEQSAFNGCTSLRSIAIPGSVKSIGSFAFCWCESLENITIPDGVERIENEVFSGTAYFDDDANWENNVLYINNHLIKAKSDISGNYTVKTGTKGIADKAFEYCEYLTGITIPGSVVNIGYWAFSDCADLAKITLSRGIKQIGYGAFSSCYSVTDVTIPDTVTEISSNLFFDCSSLESVTIPAGVKSIGGYVFYGCSALSDITIPTSVTKIGSRILSGTAIYNDSGKWKNKLLYVNNCLVDAKSDISGDCTIEAGTRVIADNVFIYSKSLKSVTIPNSVVSIGETSVGYYYAADSGKDEKIKAFKIFGTKGSAAETYAKENG